MAGFGILHSVQYTAVAATGADNLAAVGWFETGVATELGHCMNCENALCVTNYAADLEVHAGGWCSDVITGTTSLMHFKHFFTVLLGTCKLN